MARRSLLGLETRDGYGHLRDDAAPATSATEAPGQGLSHLARARLVAESMPVTNGSTENAEFEGAEWWEEHAELFAAARAEWGVLHPELFDLEASAESFIDPRLLRAVSALERAAAVGGEVDESELRSLFTPAAKGVWRFPLFTPLFCMCAIFAIVRDVLICYAALATVVGMIVVTMGVLHLLGTPLGSGQPLLQRRLHLGSLVELARRHLLRALELQLER